MTIATDTKALFERVEAEIASQARTGGPCCITALDTKDLLALARRVPELESGLRDTIDSLRGPHHGARIADELERLLALSPSTDQTTEGEAVLGPEHYNFDGTPRAKPFVPKEWFERRVAVEEELLAAAVPSPSKPDAWIEWNGGKCPVPEGDVHVRFRDGDVARDEASSFLWSHENADYDIVAYRVVKP